MAALTIAHNWTVAGAKALVKCLMTDDTEFKYEVTQRNDKKLWSITVTCDEPMNEQEFAAAIVGLGSDILDGSMSFDTQPDVIYADNH